MADSSNVISLFDRPHRVEAQLVRVVARPPSVPSNEAARTSAPDYVVVRGMAANLIDHLDSLDRKGMSEDMKDRATVLKAMAEHFLDGFQDEPDPKRSA